MQPVLKIDGAAGNDTIKIVRDPLNPTIVNVFLNSVQPVFTAKLSTLSQIQVNGLGGNDSLTVDSSNGVFASAPGIRYDGGASTEQNTLTLTSRTIRCVSME